MEEKVRVAWDARWSGGPRECAVLVMGGVVFPQSDFARHIRHINGGFELYRAEINERGAVLFLYQSGSRKTETARELVGERRYWGSWDEAEQALGLEAGSLREAFG